MGRVEGVPEHKAPLLVRLAYWYARRRLRQVPEPMTVLAHQPRIFRGYVWFELGLDRSRLVKASLKSLVQLKVATLIGCPF
ncbi:MAG: hypothetical protein HYS33_09705 [Acidobacteria bacterium]|nr:hypothetical protein [Acidobacteriota bacterium]